LTTVLLLLVADGHFSELVRSAHLLERSGRYRPIIAFLRSNSTSARDQRRCLDEGIECIDQNGDPIRIPDAATATPPSATGDESGVERARRWLVRHVPAGLKSYVAPAVERLKSGPLSYFQWRKYYRSQIAHAGRLLDRHQPRLLVLAEDNPDYVTHCYVKAGHASGIPSVIVPYTVANKIEAAEAYFRDAGHWADAFDNRLPALLYPRWTLSYQDRRLVRMPAGHLLALEALQLAPPLPWSHNSGFTDAIATESEFMRQRYLADGLPAERLSMTGTLADDALAAGLSDALAKRARLLAELGLADDRPLLLCALPPDQFPTNRPRFELQNQRELLTFLAEALGAFAQWNVVFRLHPRMQRSDVPYLEALGVHITDWDTAALVPLCDIFVASASATIRWAIACGKPVVNYDVHRYRYHDFDEAAGVITIETKAEFAATVARLATNETFRAEITARQGACAARWGKLDGRAGERMLALFDRLISRSEVVHEDCNRRSGPDGTPAYAGGT
jgi:hypothetical protein